MNATSRPSCFPLPGFEHDPHATAADGLDQFVTRRDKPRQYRSDPRPIRLPHNTDQLAQRIPSEAMLRTRHAIGARRQMVLDRGRIRLRHLTSIKGLKLLESGVHADREHRNHMLFCQRSGKANTTVSASGRSQRPRRLIYRRSKSLLRNTLSGPPSDDAVAQHTAKPDRGKHQAGRLGNRRHVHRRRVHAGVGKAVLRSDPWKYLTDWRP